MSERDASLPLRHMREAARRAIEIAEALTRQRLTADGVETLALTRLIEILGEAARRVPDEVRGAHPEIPWRLIVGTRDRLIHGYDQVDLDILWNIARHQLPPLVEQLDAVLSRCDAP